MPAEKGVHMMVGEEIGRLYKAAVLHTDGSLLGDVLKVNGEKSGKSGIAFGKEVQGAINIGGVAKMALFQFKIKVFFDSVNGK